MFSPVHFPLLATCIFITTSEISAGDKNPSLDETVTWISRKVTTNAGGDCRYTRNDEKCHDVYRYTMTTTTYDKSQLKIRFECNKTALGDGYKEEVISNRTYHFNISDIDNMFSTEARDNRAAYIHLDCNGAKMSVTGTQATVESTIGLRSGDHRRETKKEIEEQTDYLYTHFSTNEMMYRVQRAFEHAIKKAKEDDLF